MIIFKWYFVTYFFITLFDTRFVGNEKKMQHSTLIDFCVLRRVRVYTKKLIKAATFSYGFTSLQSYWEDLEVVTLDFGNYGFFLVVFYHSQEFCKLLKTLLFHKSKAIFRHISAIRYNTNINLLIYITHY